MDNTIHLNAPEQLELARKIKASHDALNLTMTNLRSQAEEAGKIRDAQVVRLMEQLATLCGVEPSMNWSLDCQYINYGQVFMGLREKSPYEQMMEHAGAAENAPPDEGNTPSSGKLH